MESKWLSRKLFVAIIGVIAIAFGIHWGSPETETAIIEQGELLITGIVGMYILIQGLVDVFKKKTADK